MNDIFKEILSKMNLTEKDLDDIKFHEYKEDENNTHVEYITLNNKEYPVERFNKTCSNCRYFIACPIKSHELKRRNQLRGSAFKFATNHGCEKYKCSFIEYPLKINFNKENLEESLQRSFEEIYARNSCSHPKRGSLVSVRPLDVNDGNKTYPGILVGDMPVSVNCVHNSISNDIEFRIMTNPMILIPELRRIVFGSGSYWRTIDNIEEFDIITDEVINNSFPTKILKEMVGD